MRTAYLLLIAASVLATSCDNRGDDATSGRTTNANANASASASNSYQFAVAEPERYRLLFDLVQDQAQPAATAPETANRNLVAGDKHPSGRGAQQTTANIRSGKSIGNDAQRIVNPTEVSSTQFELDKVGGDRRWSFQLPGIGSVVYLEKSGLKYLVLFDLKQYLEVTPADLGFDAGKSLNPVVAASGLAMKCESGNLGADQVAGRNAFRFRFSPRATDAESKRFACTVSVDQETRLPSRFEIVNESDQGSASKSIIEARELKLSVSAILFDVPVGMRKIKTSDAKPQIKSFAAGVRQFIDALNPAGFLTKTVGSSTTAGAAANGNRNARPASSAAQGNKPRSSSKNTGGRKTAISSQ